MNKLGPIQAFDSSDLATRQAAEGLARHACTLGVRDYRVIDAAATLVRHLFRDPTDEGYVDSMDEAAQESLIPLLLPALSLSLRSLDLG